MQATQEPSAPRRTPRGSHSHNGSRRSALILAGAAAKGPYAAGALTQLAADPRFEVSVVVGASSGALNAAVYAAGLRVGRAAEAAELLCKLWKEEANFLGILPWEKRMAFVRDSVARFQKLETVHRVQVRVVVTSLPGVPDDKYGYPRAEEVHGFDSDALRDSCKIEQLARYCVASAALPVLFAPRKVDGGGPYWDGGIVNNTPLGWALKGDADLDHIIVVTPETATTTKTPPQGRYWRLSVGRLVEIVIEERLNRDLREARSFNEEIEKLIKLGISASQLKAALNWRLLELLEIRPSQKLEGGLLSGFLSETRRSAYIEAGKLAAASEFARFWSSRQDVRVNGA